MTGKRKSARIATAATAARPTLAKVEAPEDKAPVETAELTPATEPAKAEASDVATVVADISEAETKPEATATAEVASVTEPVPVERVQVEQPAIAGATIVKKSRSQHYLIAASLALSVGLGWIGASAVHSNSVRNLQQETRTALTELGGQLASLSAEMQKLNETTTQIAAYPHPAMPSLTPLTNRVEALATSVERGNKEVQTKLSTLTENQDKRAAGSAKDITDKLAAVSQRVEKVEKSLVTASTSTTTAIDLTQAIPPKPEPLRLDGFILKDVYDGLAIVEDKRGIIYEVTRGDILPGAGRVSKLEKRGKRWVVLAEKGLIAGP